MTPTKFKQARQSLGLTAMQAAPMFGLRDKSRIYNIESLQEVPGWHARLMAAYLAGYRPPDWPITEKNKPGAKLDIGNPKIGYQKG